MPKRTKLLILAICLVLLGFLRDYLFININWIYLTLTIDRPNQALNEFHFLLTWSVAQLELLKWILTILFSLFFFGLTYWLIRVAFQTKRYNRITLYTFLALFTVSGIFYTAGWVLGILPQTYGIVRTLMGYVQSFIPAMILYVTFRFMPGSDEVQE